MLINNIYSLNILVILMIYLSYIAIIDLHTLTYTALVSFILINAGFTTSLISLKVFISITMIVGNIIHIYYFSVIAILISLLLHLILFSKFIRSLGFVAFLFIRFTRAG